MSLGCLEMGARGRAPGLSSTDGASRIEYGPAVAGRAAISGLLRAGRIGATDIPLDLTEMVPASGRTLLPVGFAAPLGFSSAGSDTLRTGETLAMAEPGLAGSFLASSVAFFCAIICSRKLDLLRLMVLLDRPRPGRAASSFLGELGLLGSLFRSFWAVESRSSLML